MQDKFESAKNFFLEGSKQLEQGNLELAEISLLKSLELLPNRESTLNNLSIIYCEKANLSADRLNYEGAVELYKKSLGYNPKNTVSLCNLGIIQNDHYKNFDLAIKYFEDAISLSPENSLVYFHLANALSSKNYFSKAIFYLDKAIDFDNKFAEAWLNKGVALKELKQEKEALTCFNKAIELKPNYSNALTNKGVVLLELKLLREALNFFEKALKIAPNDPNILTKIGATLNFLGEYDNAHQQLDRAIAIAPNYAEAFSNKGITFNFQKKHTEALNQFNKAINLDSNQPEINHNRSLLNLFLKKFNEGWDEYHTRLAAENFKFPLNVKDVPLWSGEGDISELLVICEQGIGDNIFYSRYIESLKSFAKNITVLTDKRLIKIFSRSFNKIEFIDKNQTINHKKFNNQIPIGSIPAVLKINPTTCKLQTKFLQLNNDLRINILSSKNSQNKILCGLSWKSANQKIGGNKSLSLLKLESILKNQDCAFVNLQYGEVSKEISEVKSQLGVDIAQMDGVDLFEDIDGLLSIINACDIVVTTSNITAHLAGAIGKKTLLLVPYAQGRIWYWHDDEVSIWYPSIKQYFQDADLSWDNAINKIAAELEQEIARKN